MLKHQEINMANTFSCGVHNFSTNNIGEWDEHLDEVEHEYDLHIPCANGCGVKLHIKPKQTVSKAAKRIPRGYLCNDCKEKVKDAPEIKEAGEIANV